MNPIPTGPAQALGAPVPANAGAAGFDADHPVFDASVLGDMFADEPALIASVLQTFAASAAAALSDLRVAMAAQDLAQAHALAHKISGASRLTGARALGHLAHQLELAAKQGDLGAANAALQRLAAQWPLTQAAIGNMLSG